MTKAEQSLGDMPWDEAARPHGPEPDGEADHTARQFATGRHLVLVHDHLRQELQRVRYLVDQVVNGSASARDARQEMVAMVLRQEGDVMGAYCQAYCRLVSMHHSIEDSSVFPHLRRSDPRLAAVLERLQLEHQAVHEVILSVDSALRDYAEAPLQTACLKDAVELLSRALLSHLRYEEEELVEPLARLGFY